MEQKKNLKCGAYTVDEQRGYLWVGEYLGRRSLGMKIKEFSWDHYI